MIRRRTNSADEGRNFIEITADDQHQRKRSRRLRRWCLVAALTFIGLTLSGFIPPHRSGFTCDDPYIRKSYYGDSISIYTLFGGTLIGPIVLFAVTEAIHQSRLLAGGSSKESCMELDRGPTSFSQRRFFSRWGRLVGDYLLGFVYVLAAVELGKVLMGELRPHFLDTCRPDWRLINCSQGLVTNYVCLGDIPKWLKADMFKSFPSGHAAISFYCFIFSSMYSQMRISRTNYSHLLRSWVQLLFLFWACLCSITRMTDNRHHWWDVLVGIILGVLGGIFTSKCIVQNDFRPLSRPKTAKYNETLNATEREPVNRMTSL